MGQGHSQMPGAILTAQEVTLGTEVCPIQRRDINGEAEDSCSSLSLTQHGLL